MITEENLKLEKLPKIRRGRKRGQKDQKLRKTKKILTAKEERKVLEQYQSGAALSDIRKEFNISRAALRNVTIRHKVPRRFVVLKEWKQIDLSQAMFKSVGVYAICSFNLNSEKSKEHDKVYFGSSVNIKARLQSHYNLLVKNKHFNTELQKDFNSGNRVFKTYLVEECEEGKELLLESKYLQGVCKSSLYNTWKAPKLDKLIPFLRKAVNLERFKNYTINSETGCWECNSIHKTGYGRMGVRLNDKIKYFYTHRVSYWNKTGEYPELVRHLCNNKKCINPDHLASGNYRDNSLDKFKEFNKEFEKVWIELKADSKKITEYFKWEKCRWPNGRADVSSQVYTWERKLGLREKYPDIYKNSRRIKSQGN